MKIENIDHAFATQRSVEIYFREYFSQTYIGGEVACSREIIWSLGEPDKHGWRDLAFWDSDTHVVKALVRARTPEHSLLLLDFEDDEPPVAAVYSNSRCLPMPMLMAGVGTPGDWRPA